MLICYLLQLNVIYNVKDSRSSRIRKSIQDQEAFDLDIAVKDNNDDVNHLNLSVCTRLVSELLLVLLLLKNVGLKI